MERWVAAAAGPRRRRARRAAAINTDTRRRGPRRLGQCRLCLPLRRRPSPDAHTASLDWLEAEGGRAVGGAWQAWMMAPVLL